MVDYILRIHEQQMELAKRIGAAIFYSLPADLEHLVLAANPLLSHFPINDRQLKELDLTMCVTVIRLDIVHDTFKAIAGYTDWMASKLIRSGNLEPQTLPVLSDDAVDQISVNMIVKAEMIRKVAEYLEHPGTEIWPIGDVLNDRHLATNTNMLREWASHYKWD